MRAHIGPWRRAAAVGIGAVATVFLGLAAEAQLTRDRGRLRAGPSPLVASEVEGYDIAVTTGASGQFLLTRTQFGSGPIAGSVFGDPIQGFVDYEAGEATWVRLTNGAPSQLYVASYSREEAAWYGVMHALDATTSGATADRNAWGFRAARNAIGAPRVVRPFRPAGGLGTGGPNPADPTPPATDPDGVSDPFPLGGGIERWYALDRGNGQRSWLKAKVAANGVVSGTVGEGAVARVVQSNGRVFHRDPAGAEQIVGHYAANAGMLALVRVRTSPAGQLPEVIEAYTAVLEDASPLAGSLHPIAAAGDGGGLRREWREASRYWLRNTRHSDCLDVENASVDPGAGLLLQSCQANDEGQRWSIIETAGSPFFVMTSSRSGLCITVAVDVAAPFEQRPCAGAAGAVAEAARQIVRIDGAISEVDPVSGQVEVGYDRVIALEGIPNYDAIQLVFSIDGKVLPLPGGSPPFCPGVNADSFPNVISICDGSTRSLWREY